MSLTVVASLASIGTTPWSVITAKFSSSFAMFAIAAQTLASTWNLEKNQEFIVDFWQAFSYNLEI